MKNEKIKTQETCESNMKECMNTMGECINNMQNMIPQMSEIFTVFSSEEDNDLSDLCKTLCQGRSSYSQPESD